MDKISSFSGVFNVFKISGMQYFSLNPDKTRNFSKYDQLFAVLPFIFSMFLYTFVFITLSIVKFIEFELVKDDLLQQDALNFLMELVLFITGFATIFASFVFSWIRKELFVRFFKNVDKLSAIWKAEFCHRINYTRLKRNFKISLAIYLFICGINVYTTTTSSWKESQANGWLLMNIWKVVPSFAAYTIYLKFNFLVRIIDFHLKTMREMIKQEFLMHDETLKTNAVDVFCVVDINNQKPRKASKLLTCSSLIREMCDQISLTMGLTILLLLFMVFMNFTRNVFAFFMILNRNREENMESE